ncbi:alpha/beta hydrolase [Rhodococcus opacus]|nr:alpha/beta hydrolase [Rhodococcus opacus]MBV6760576.1 alpha/beta hydrolase [Rhodococcus opacus]
MPSTPIADKALAFEAAFPVRSRPAGGFDWRYYAGGSGDVVLLLTGGVGIGIGWLDLGLSLEGRYRVIAVDYPPACSFADLADGVTELLAAENVDRAHVVGQSMGGMLAEVLSRRSPTMVRSLVLTGTGFYGEEDRPRLVDKRTQLEKNPWEAVREQIRQALRATWKGSDDLEFWLERVDAATDGEAGRARTIAGYDAFLDLIGRLPAMLEQPGWKGPTLLVRSDDDPLITERQVGRLLQMHPDAEVRHYATGGHSLLVSRPEDYLHDVMSFLAEQPA